MYKVAFDSDSSDIEVLSETEALTIKGARWITLGLAIGQFTILHLIVNTLSVEQAIIMMITLRNAIENVLFDDVVERRACCAQTLGTTSTRLSSARLYSIETIIQAKVAVTQVLGHLVVLLSYYLWVYHGVFGVTSACGGRRVSY